MEHLTRQQLILLALLVSFVTSIATGIVTVRLLEQAPPPITRTINRVVERTIEKIVPDKSQKASVITKETTLVVKEEDLITETIEKGGRSLVRLVRLSDKNSGDIASTSAEERADEFEVAGFGVLVSQDGKIITDVSLFPSEKSAPDSYRLLIDGKFYGADFIQADETGGLALVMARLEAGGSGSVGAEVPSFAYSALADPSSFKLGQTIISLGGMERDTIAMGVISELVMPAQKNENKEVQEQEKALGEDAADAKTTEDKPRANEEKKSAVALETTLPYGNLAPGVPIFNIFGELAAVVIYDSGGENYKIIPSGRIDNLLSSAAASAENRAE